MTIQNEQYLVFLQSQASSVNFFATIYNNFKMGFRGYDSKEHFKDLGKLNLLIDFRLKPIFTIAPTSSKNNTQFKSGQI